MGVAHTRAAQSIGELGDAPVVLLALAREQVAAQLGRFALVDEAVEGLAETGGASSLPRWGTQPVALSGFASREIGFLGLPPWGLKERKGSQSLPGNQRENLFHTRCLVKGRFAM